MKALAIRTLYRVIISLLLFVGFVVVGIVIPIDIAWTIIRFIWIGIENTAYAVYEDVLEIVHEGRRVLVAFAEAFRRGRP